MACVCSWLSKHWVCFWVMLHLCSTICDAGDFQVVGPDGPLTAAAGAVVVMTILIAVDAVITVTNTKRLHLHATDPLYMF
ncbi:uncharacterized protein LOC143137406 isoform X4 [Alosa pseudoharengus]|uniref:uncharacterized protein LOC143137406 isoform X4 n=1 Tax=Alosa pseudoharengus TaxID=34774 RepID=UPI003F88ACD9